MQIVILAREYPHVCMYVCIRGRLRGSVQLRVFGRAADESRAGGMRAHAAGHIHRQGRCRVPAFVTAFACGLRLLRICYDRLVHGQPGLRW